MRVPLHFVNEDTSEGVKTQGGVVTHAMTVLTRVQLNEKLRGNSVLHQGRSLDVSIWRLRRLIEIDPSEPRYVQTVWGRGYVFVPHGELGAAERDVMVAPGV